MTHPQPATGRPYHNHSDAALLDLADTHHLRIAQSDLVLKAINDEIIQRHAATVQADYDNRDRSHGEVTLEMEGATGLQLKGKISKKVTWDSPKLEALATRTMLPREQGGLGWAFAQLRKFFKIEFSVPEKNMTVAEAAFTEELLALLTAARTVKFAPLAVQLVRKGGGQ
jgi:hypothetical protein